VNNYGVCSTFRADVMVKPPTRPILELPKAMKSVLLYIISIIKNAFNWTVPRLVVYN
jgi:hypothetical protein